MMQHQIPRFEASEYRLRTINLKVHHLFSFFGFNRTAKKDGTFMWSIDFKNERKKLF